MPHAEDTKQHAQQEMQQTTGKISPANPESLPSQENTNELGKTQNKIENKPQEATTQQVTETPETVAESIVRFPTDRQEIGQLKIIDLPSNTIQAVQEGNRIFLGEKTEVTKDHAEIPELVTPKLAPVTTLEGLASMLDALNALLGHSPIGEDTREDLLFSLENESDEIGKMQDLEGKSFYEMPTLLREPRNSHETQENPEFILLVDDNIMDFIEDAKEAIDEITETPENIVYGKNIKEATRQQLVTLSTGKREITIDVELLKRITKLRSRRYIHTVPFDINTIALEELGLHPGYSSPYDLSATTALSMLLVYHSLVFLLNSSNEHGLPLPSLSDTMRFYRQAPIYGNSA